MQETCSSKDVKVCEDDKANKTPAVEPEDPAISKYNLLKSLAKKPNRK